MPTEDARKSSCYLVRGYLNCIRGMSDAGEATAARETIEAMVGSPEWRGADLFLVADLRLLSASVYWRQQRYLEEHCHCNSCVFTRPVILGRLLEPFLRRLRLAGPALCATFDVFRSTHGQG
jgi:hypothetical protein